MSYDILWERVMKWEIVQPRYRIQQSWTHRMAVSVNKITQHHLLLLFLRRVVLSTLLPTFMFYLFRIGSVYLPIFSVGNNFFFALEHPPHFYILNRIAWMVHKAHVFFNIFFSIFALWHSVVSTKYVTLDEKKWKNTWSLYSIVLLLLSLEKNFNGWTNCPPIYFLFANNNQPSNSSNSNK